MGILNLKNTIIKIKSSVDKFNSRMERTEEKVSKWKDRTTEMILSDPRREKSLKKKKPRRRPKSPWDYSTKHPMYPYDHSPRRRGESREQRNKTLNRKNPKQYTPRHTMKLLKTNDKGKILKKDILKPHLTYKWKTLI